MALPKFQGHGEVSIGVGWGPVARSGEASLRKILSEPSLEEGGAGRRRDILKYTYIGWVSQHGSCSVRTLVETETCNQDPGSSLSYRITRAFPWRMKEYWIQESVHCVHFGLQVSACVWLLTITSLRMWKHQENKPERFTNSSECFENIMCS